MAIPSKFHPKNHNFGLYLCSKYIWRCNIQLFLRDRTFHALKGILQSKVDKFFKERRVHFQRIVWAMHSKKISLFLLKCDLSDLSPLIFRPKSRDQKLHAGLLLNQVDLIFTVSHTVCCLSSHRLHVGNWQGVKYWWENASGFKHWEHAQNIQVAQVCKISQEDRLLCEISTVSYFHMG